MHLRSSIGWTQALLFALLATLSLAASAQRVEGDRAVARGIYEAEVPVNGQGPGERNAGFARALAQVLAKVSGDRNAAGRPGIGEELRRARDFVEGYDYRQDEGVSATGAPSFRTTLVVRFKKAEVDTIASTLGLAMWPQPRPKPVLWLAIDDGRGARLVGLPQANAAKAVTQRAVERGYKLGLPAGSAAEQAAVGAIWRGDAAAIARLSSRYSPPMQLIGKLYRAGSGWAADWMFVDAGKVLNRWSSKETDARRALASGADGTADALSRKHAKRGTAPARDAVAGTYRVIITGINSGEDFIRVSAYLQGLSIVKRITPLRATPDSLELNLQIQTGLPGLRRVIGGGGVLSGGEGDPPVFRLR